MSYMEDAQEFKRVYALPVETDDSLRASANNVKEEYREFLDALWAYCMGPGSEKFRAKLLKEMADLVYTVFQVAADRGWDLDEALRLVHASNLSKLGEDGKPIMKDGKVLKGPNYKPPWLGHLVTKPALSPPESAE